MSWHCLAGVWSAVPVQPLTLCRGLPFVNLNRPMVSFVEEAGAARSRVSERSSEASRSDAASGGPLSGGIRMGSERNGGRREIGSRPWNEDGWFGALVAVDSGSFRKFDRRMDRQLARLVRRWAPLAAPCALRRYAMGLGPPRST